MEGKYLEGSHGMGKEKGRAGKTESRKEREERIRAEEKEETVQDKRNELVRSELDYGEWDDAEAIGKLFRNYGRNLKEYLVDGAILTCSRATTEVKTINGVEFGLGGSGINGERKNTVLTIPFSESVSNRRYMATVKHCKEWENIRPFECNCENPPERAEETAKIFGDLEECREYGICRKLMRLENEWENMVGETEYFTGSTGDGEKAEKITMMSMLFCSHGGLITPVTSGQESCLWYVSALACSTGGKRSGGLTQREKEWNAAYIYNYFSKRGWSGQAICGLLGNIQDESQMNPGAWQGWHNTGIGYGLVQWSAGTKYLDYMEKLGLLHGIPINEADRAEDLENKLDVEIRAYQVDALAKTDPFLLMNSQLAFFEETIRGNKDMGVLQE